MASRQQVEFLSRLKTRTERGLVSWQLDADSGEVSTKIGDHHICMDMPVTANGITVRIRVTDSSGNVVDSMVAEDFDTSDLYTAYVITGPFGYMNDLYNIARRQALGSDRVLETLLAQM